MTTLLKIAEINKQAAEQATINEKKADVNNQKRINNLVLNALCEHADIDRETGIRVLTAIVHGKVPAVSVDYTWSVITA